MSRVEIYQTEYNGWKNCLCMQNDVVRLIVTLDVGPRVIFFGAVDGPNLFYQNPAQQGLTGSEEWMAYGGHRLWHGPQVKFRPNQPDNQPVHCTVQGNTATLVSEPEQRTQVQKKMEITLVESEPRVKLKHKIYNLGEWPIELAPWSLTAMKENGKEIFPFPQDDTFYLPNYAICCWPWTKLNDPRFKIGDKYFYLTQDPQKKEWFKIGYRNPEGWGAYYNEEYLFVKLYELIPDAVYPDYGSSFETYTDEYFVELESIAPLQTIAKNECAVHEEEWYLFSNIAFPETESDTDAIAAMIHRIK